MKIELRKVSYSAKLSEETSNFHAEIWIDGKKEGYAQNNGTGGPTNVLPNTLRVRLDEYGKTLPQVDIGRSTGGEQHMIVQDAEWIVDDLLSDWIARRDLKRSLRNRALYTLTDGPGIMQTKPLTADQLAQILASEDIKVKWKVKAWLNTMPEEEALKVFRSGAT